MHVISRDQLPEADAFEGVDHDVPLSFFLIDMPPGAGPALHQHDYAEVFIVVEGESTFQAGDETQAVRAGQIVVVSANTPHRFFNSGSGRLRQVDIHASARFVTEWLDATTPKHHPTEKESS